MELEPVVLKAWKAVWTQPRLWLLGIFVASAGGTAPVRMADRSGEPLPAWLPPVLVAAAVLGFVLFVMHVLSEAALIELIARPEKPLPPIRRALARARRFFGRVFALKALTAGAFLVGLAVVVLPAFAAALAHALPLGLGVALTVLLAIVAVPFALTLYFLYQYALRFAVIDDRPTREAFREAHLYLHGKLARSLVLLIIAGLSGPLAGIAGLAGVLPAAALGLLVYFVAGLNPAVVVFAVLAVPVAIVVAGIAGSFQSSLWTTAFLETRGEVSGAAP